MTSTLWYDSETYSETPIKHGTYRYAEDAEITIITYAVDDAPVRAVDLTAEEAWPAELLHALGDDDVLIYAHNSMFDRAVLSKHGLPTRRERWRDTMVQALAHSLPGGLEALCEIVGVPLDKAKHKTGKDLVQLFCKPRPKNMDLRRATRETHPEQWAQFLEYACADVDAMREVHKRLPQWNYGDRTDYGRREIANWHLDQRINDRGIEIDTDLVDKAVVLIAEEQRRLAAETYILTNGEVDRASKRDAMLLHIFEEYGVDLPDLRGSTIDRRLEDPDLPRGLKELLALRQMTSTTSTSKYKALARAVNDDGRLRGTLQYNGASRTGRWAGRVFQPQNLPSRGLLPLAKVREGIDAIKGGYVHVLGDDYFEHTMLLTASSIRGCLTAPKGRRFCIADLSNIEGRMLAWEAGEEWKLKAFADYDAGIGHDLYVMAYARSFGVDPATVTKKQRAVGKVQELALGYEGGVGAFVTFASAYGIDLEQMAKDAWETLPAELKREAFDFYDWIIGKKRGRDFGLSREAYVTCEVFKRAWRYGHPNVTALWAGVQSICVKAVEHPGETFAYGRFKARKVGVWLRLLGPSGRSLCYPSPHVERDGKRANLTYMGVHQYTRKWCRLHTHGGKLVENITQMLACEVLKANMPAAEQSGYELVLSVHDELIAEAPDADEYTGDGLAAIMSRVPDWAEGLPLAAAGFHDYRYRKDE